MSHPEKCAAMNGRVDKAELIAKLQSLQGLTDGERGELIRLLRTHKKYGLVWEDKPEDVEERLRDELPVLREVKERAILAPSLGGGQAPNHILIEGDNLEALTALSYTHEGKIDVIYIDPPYNTGNKDFVYNDSFVDSEDSYRHSKWLSFMNKRLKIAKRLLSDKGVIFISIDDNEQAQLKLLCDEVFGQDAFVSSVVWQKKTGASDAKGLAVITEYILVYCPKADIIESIFSVNKEAYDIRRYRFTDEYLEERGPFYFDSLDRGSVRYSDTLNYPIMAPDGTPLYPNDRTSFQNDGWTWKWSKDKVNWGLKSGFISLAKNAKKKCGWSVRYKIYLNVDNEGNPIKKNAPYKNMITDVLNADAANDIKNIFEGKAFSFPKPVKLIRHIINYIADPSSLILDFFAGSGTTLHATMQLNAEDGGHRQCILVTNNENGICENVTYERNKRVINGYTTPKGVKVPGLKDNSLRYYQTDFVSRDRTQRNMRELVSAATDMLCIKEDVYEERHTFGHFHVNPKLMRYFSDGRKHMLVVYREEIVDELATEITTMDFGAAAPLPSEGEGGRLKIYIFSPGRYAFDDNFFEVRDKVQLVALPAAIYDAYQKVLPHRREKLLALAKEEEQKNPAEGAGEENE